ncbi:5-bromo-4-chloroindolyl phosphate hydrolysis family protein [Maritimibacter sp. DP1N21-5]|uniref:5-bromo-4-chloroindolyl phosphate hydrolysis family protein n=1 Tax=Maritimibacter sp. DP1N21-5 TaxID=2836867 RepID=UPI001C496BD9|nr:5-bromo-4-chloroindolyl phosphate hydrolysis family protein [Maritimibacter sp. DP1N21-5]MBV7409128.1 5-bromo-4-chloroindolyl phosphate hydrolysis family protein [Maritimibacter sp. DP1N21-5]
MAGRYGGKYSPDGDGPQTNHPPRPAFDGQVRARAGGRVNFLFLAPLPLAVSAFFLDPAGLALRLVAFGTLILAAWLTREGVIAQEAYDARKIARRPAFPRKIAGSLLTGAGLGLAGLASGPVNAVIFAVLGAALHVMAFGPDPMKNKGLEGVDEFQTDRVARAVGEAEKLLGAMKDAVVRARDREAEARVDSFLVTARNMFRTIEDDPRDLSGARKYLTVYLMGARDATAKFADIYVRSRDPAAKSDYFALLDDLERNFTARTQKMLTADQDDLNVEIEVLRERLAREGVVAGRG